MTNDKIKKLEDAFAIDASIDEACYYANISHQTYYNWLKKKPELVERFERLRQKPVLTARQVVVKALATDPEMALKYLERKKRKEFGNDSMAQPAPIHRVTLNFINAPNSNGNILGPGTEDRHLTSIPAQLSEQEEDSDK